jgi:hypothetical protein
VFNFDGSVYIHLEQLLLPSSYTKVGERDALGCDAWNVMLGM